MKDDNINKLANRLQGFDADELQREMTDGLEQWCRKRGSTATVVRHVVSLLLILVTISAVAMTAAPSLRHALLHPKNEAAEPVAESPSPAPSAILPDDPEIPPQSADEAVALLDAQACCPEPPEVPKTSLGDVLPPYDFVALTAMGDSIFCKVRRVARDVSISFHFAEHPPQGYLSLPSEVRHDGLVYSVIALDDSALADCRELRHVTLPTTLAAIGRDAFNGCSALDTLVALSPTPPAITGEWCFWDVPQEAVLMVPCRSGVAYRTAHCWDAFDTIVDTCEVPPLPDAPQPIIKFNGNYLVVEGVFGDVVRVYDIEGRLLASELCNGMCRISIGNGRSYHHTSAFLVQVGDSPAIKVSAPLRNSTSSTIY